MARCLGSCVAAGLLLCVVSLANAEVPPKAALPKEKTTINLRDSVGFCADFAFSPDSKLLVMAELTTKKVRLWDIETGKVVRELPHREVRRVAFSPDGKVIATASRHIKLWDTASGKELAEHKVVSAHWLLFSADGKQLAAIAKGIITILPVGHDDLPRFYDITSSRRNVFGYPTDKKPVYALPRGKDDPLGFVLVDPFTQKEVKACKTPRPPHLFATDRQGDTLAVLHWGYEVDQWGRPLRKDWQSLLSPEVRVWHRGQRKEIANLKLEDGFVPVMALSPDGKILVIALQTRLDRGSSSWLLFYRIPSGERLASLEHSMSVPRYSSFDQGIRVLTFSPDGRLLATRDGWSEVKIWSLPDAWRKKK